MTTLKIRGERAGGAAVVEPGSWGHLVAWFSEMVGRLDRGDLPGAIEAQSELERHGFKVTFRRRHAPPCGTRPAAGRPLRQ